VILEEHYNKIEDYTNKFSKSNYPYERLTLTKNEALRLFQVKIILMFTKRIIHLKFSLLQIKFPKMEKLQHINVEI